MYEVETSPVIVVTLVKSKLHSGNDLSFQWSLKYKKQ